ncbi:hypothetical protein ACFQH6_17635 [Halobacteriaceae archaeon GCM10025711]
MADRFVASVGFVVAGLALAAALLPWTPTLAVGPFGSPVAAGLAGVTVLGFGARRYDVVDDPGASWSPAPPASASCSTR